MSPPRLPLRDYQEQAIAASRALWRTGERGALVVLPTGTGKTFTALRIVADAAARGHRALWLAHREELLAQPARSLRVMAPELALLSGIVKAGRNEADKRIVFGSVDTLRSEKRLAAYLAHGAPLLVVADEAHHFRKNSRETLLDRLDEARKAIDPKGQPCFRLGLTATPDRADKVSLAPLWRIAFAYPLPRAIREGHLVPVTFARRYLDALDLSNVKLNAQGDYNEDELAAALLEAHVVDHTVAAMRDLAPERRSLIFTASVDQARQTAEGLRAAGIEARFVCGDTPDEERRGMLRAFEAGTVRALASCMVLTEGTDLPPADCIVMARPTRSRPLYVQAMGRGLRPYPGKADCLALDIVGATEEHEMIVAPVLLRDLEREEQEAEAKESKPGKGEHDWKRHPKPVAAWASLRHLDRGGYAVGCGEHGNAVLIAEADDSGLWMAYLIHKGSEAPTPLCSEPVDFGLAQALGEDVARRAGSLTRRAAKWRGGPASDRQMAALARFGDTDGSWMTAGEAANRLTEHIARRAVARYGLAQRTDKSPILRVAR